MFETSRLEYSAEVVIMRVVDSPSAFMKAFRVSEYDQPRFGIINLNSIANNDNSPLPAIEIAVILCQLLL